MWVITQRIQLAGGFVQVNEFILLTAEKGRIYNPGRYCRVATELKGRME
jgi:hypothetical protein